MSESNSKQNREKALIWSLILFHAWGTLLVVDPTEIGAKMFEAVCWGILANLGILAGEKVLRILVELKWGGKRNVEDGA